MYDGGLDNSIDSYIKAVHFELSFENFISPRRTLPGDVILCDGRLLAKRGLKVALIFQLASSISAHFIVASSDTTQAFCMVFHSAASEVDASQICPLQHI